MLDEVTKYFGSRKALDIASFELAEGGIHALVGPNGAGKTTLLRLMALLEAPNSGRILYRMKEVHPRFTSTSIKREITMVSHNPVMFGASVFSNVAYGLRVRGIPRADMETRVKEALCSVGLDGFGKRRAKKLSSGEAQRVALARALAVKPRVLLLDEPTANLDPMSGELIENLIRRLREEENVTVVISSHNLSQAYRLADNVITMLDGQIAQSFAENLFKANIYRDGEESKARLGGREISLVTERVGSAYISINPKEIIVSLHKVHSSARNCLPGRIIKIVDRGGVVFLGVEAGVEFNVQITHKSFCELGLTIGKSVYLIFKSSAVQVF